MANKMQIKRGLKSKLPRLAIGEPGFCTDTGELFVGGTSKNVGYATSEALDIVTTQSNENATQFSTQLAQTAKLVNVKAFGAKGNNADDDATAIQLALDYAKGSNCKTVYVPAGSYRIGKSLTIPTGINFVGDGAYNTIIRTNNANIDGLSVEAGAYRTKILDMNIAAWSKGDSNSGINFDPTLGAHEVTMQNLIIADFKYGTRCANLYWMNKMENVRWNQCDISFFGEEGTIGTSINNLFIQCYSDRATVGAVSLRAFKNTEFINCNFGGRKGFGDQHTYLFKFQSNCMGMRVSGANFEHHVAPTVGLIQIWSGSTVKFDSCNFLDITATEQGWYIVARDSSKITLNDCTVINERENMRGVQLLNDAELIHFGNRENGSLLDILNTSSKIVKTFADSLPPYKGTTTIKGGGVISTGIGSLAQNVQLTIIRSDDSIGAHIIPYVVQRYSDGGVKVRFARATGAEDYNSHDVSWLAWK